jgi:hypothetical protein
MLAADKIQVWRQPQNFSVSLALKAMGFRGRDFALNGFPQ